MINQKASNYWVKCEIERASRYNGFKYLRCHRCAIHLSTDIYHKFHRFQNGKTNYIQYSYHACATLTHSFHFFSTFASNNDRAPSMIIFLSCSTYSICCLALSSAVFCFINMVLNDIYCVMRHLCLDHNYNEECLVSGLDLGIDLTAKIWPLTESIV